MKLKDLTKLPWKRIGGTFSVGSPLTSLKGAPMTVGGSFKRSPCFGQGTILSLPGETHTLHNIHKTKKIHDGSISIPPSVKSHIMGLMFIKKLRCVSTYGDNEDLEQATAIITKHLQGDRDVHACQEELIEAGYGEYAKL